MSFAAPLGLLALLVIPAVALALRAARRRRRRYAVRHPGVAVLAGVLPAAPARWRRAVPATLLAAAVCAMSLALARPERTVAVPVERASVMLVTDQSGSMAATDVQPTRMEAAKAAARSFVDRVPDGLLVGFTAYAGAVTNILEPTADHAAVRGAVDAIAPDGGTATGDALTAALDRLESRKGRDGDVAPAAIVLLSDGKTTAGADPAEAAQRARRLGIPVSTVALGTAEGSITTPLGQVVPVPPDPETLRAIARTSGGEAYAVEDGAELDRIYERLGSRIGTKREVREVSAAFAAGGLVLLLAGVGTSLRWRSRVA